MLEFETLFSLFKPHALSLQENLYPDSVKRKESTSWIV
jgi:hypothetical protein